MDGAPPSRKPVFLASLALRLRSTSSARLRSDLLGAASVPVGRSLSIDITAWCGAEAASSTPGTSRRTRPNDISPSPAEALAGGRTGSSDAGRPCIPTV
eukprot:CAMPEP_0194307524 /NCGR_PEP_ID=MMETSP0171-20130528/4430_1 /TAXON_ID=218684 /ORGANISM="Corethron pennatum, Strain L29A3" /LENGTH=98 /DNA_ID=CAMNT_0039059647 /DNA_START=398 /DNA_END=694 /DNA_ORIENTATION=-